MASISSTIVLITGANQGIGLAIARKLATEQPTYHILLGSRSAEKGLAAAAPVQAAGLSIEPVTIDVTSDASISAAFEFINAKFGKLDVLINNAGIGSGGVDPDASGSTSLRHAMLSIANTNAIGAAIVTEAFLPLLRQAGKEGGTPRVVFMSSQLGSACNRDEADKSLAYKASKAMMNKICLFYAQMFEKAGWKVNACCPGHIGTNLNGFTGKGTVEEGAVNAVRLATLGRDGETGRFSNKEGFVEW